MGAGKRISTARRFIYTETPGFCGRSDRKVQPRLQALPGLRLMICAPQNPDFAPGYEGMATYEV